MRTTSLYLVEGVEVVVILLLAYYLFKLHKEMRMTTDRSEETVEE